MEEKTLCHTKLCACIGDKEYKFWFLPILRCVLALHIQYFPESCQNISQVCYSGGIGTHDIKFAILEQCLTT